MNKYQEVFQNLTSHVEKLQKMVGAYYRFDEEEVINYETYDRDKVMIKNLVARATPKKPARKYYITKHGSYGEIKRVDIRCPCCNSVFTNGVRNSVGVYASREKNFIKTVEEIKYCGYCSQAIDWSEEE